MKIVFTGGGTSGHALPAAEIAAALREKAGAEIVYIGNEQYIEKQVSEQFGFSFFNARSKGMEGSSFWDKYVGFALENIKGFQEAQKLLAKLRPDFVFSTGGFAAAPVLAAAKMGSVPYMLHEQNASMGKVNRLFAKGAAKIFFSFPIKGYEQADAVGNPVKFNGRLAANGERVLFLGGSGGSRAINGFAVEFAKNHPDIPCELIAGEKLLAEAQARKQRVGAKNIDIVGYTNGMLPVYQRAKIAVARSGAGTIFELMNLGVPAIFVPLPDSADGHQQKNADYAAGKGAALAIKQNEGFEQRLEQTLIELFENETKRGALRENTALIAKPRAADQIADQVLGYANTHLKK